MFLFFWSDVVCAYCLFAEQVWSLFWHRPCFVVFFSLFFFFFFLRNLSSSSSLVLFFFLTNPFVQYLKLLDLLPIFVLLCVLSFLLDLIITSYQCISQNSLEKLKQKETVQTSKTGHGSQNSTIRPRFAWVFVFFPIERFLKLKNRKIERFSIFPIGPYGPVRVSKPYSFDLWLKNRKNWNK